jgi:protein O-mannose beta-1,4-N-acetylglucosaminyltransferase
LDLTSIDNHNVFYFDFVDVDESFFSQNLDLKIEFVSELSFLFKRYHGNNIMHSIHDDLLGLYFLMREYASPNLFGPPSDASGFNLKHHIQFLDEYFKTKYGHLFRYFTDFPLRFLSDLNKEKTITCFRDSIVGMSKIANWYQYGFDIPQGPLNKTVNGLYIRQFSSFIEHRLKLTPRKLNSVPYRVVLFSRTLNRLILNQEELTRELELRYGQPVDIVSMESNSFRSQVKILRETKIAIGLHGSILIMGMFLPPGSILVELFPYAIPSENYTPYRTMCQLPGMNIIYKAWEVNKEDPSIFDPIEF